MGRSSEERTPEGTDTDGAAAVRDTLLGEVSDATVDRVLSLYDQHRGLESERGPPSEDQISYPEDMDAVDRVLHVLQHEQYRERSVEWIATAADVPEEVCGVILGVLVTCGVVRPPHPYGPDGYRLSPYYDVYQQVERNLDRLTPPGEVPAADSEE